MQHILQVNRCYTAGEDTVLTELSVDNNYTNFAICQKALGALEDSQVCKFNKVRPLQRGTTQKLVRAHVLSKLIFRSEGERRGLA